MCHILCISLYNSLPTPFFYGSVYLGSGLKGVSSIQTCFFFFFFFLFMLFAFAFALKINFQINDRIYSWILGCILKTTQFID